MNKSNEQQSQKCPYCQTPVIQTSVRGKYVNGLKPISGKGCEFCNPTPLRAIRRLERRVAL
jgi:hypothetical protein